ncbi:MAG: signal peptide peptidase SppA [Alphaproteobacteria bacterium]|nr:signal peptide peptidase SppA [Alphaproteobacteria bacterium]
MTIDADGIVARRRLRRWLAFWRVLAIVSAAALILGTLTVMTGFDPIGGKPHILRVTVSGIVFDDPEILLGLAEAADDDSTLAVLVVIDTPGGTTTGGESIYRELRRIGERGVPVVAVIRTVGASAGYMVALAADQIYALETSITGSIGVLLETAEVSGLLERLGVTAETFRSAPLKGQPSLFQPLNDQTRVATQSLIDDVYGWFLEIFAERRELPTETARDLADGRAYTGRQALSLGLIDSIGGEREALQWLAESRGIPVDVPVIDLEREDTPATFFDLITGLTKKTLLSERLRLDGLMSVWHPAQN